MRDMPCLERPPKMLEEEVGSKTGTEELIPRSCGESFGVGQDIGLTSENRDETPWAGPSAREMCTKM